MIKYVPASSLKSRFNVNRSTIWTWIQDGRFQMPEGIEGEPVNQTPKGRWYVAEAAVKELERQMMMEEGAIKVIVPKQFQLRLQANEDIMVVALSMLRQYGGTITVNHDQQTAMFYGIERQSPLPYPRVKEMIEDGTLIIWNKDDIYGDYYWPKPELDMVVR